MASTGLSADRDEYRARLADTTDEQIDTWVSELLRDVVKRRGIVRVQVKAVNARAIDSRHDLRLEPRQQNAAAIAWRR